MKLTAIALAVASSSALRASSGCGKENTNPTGALFHHAPLTVATGELEATRKFVEFIPDGYRASTPMPLMVWLHGQYGKAIDEARQMDFQRYPLVQLYPQGLDDNADANCGTGWDVGPSAHDASTCTAAAYSGTCCYASCRALGDCAGDGAAASCGWATCHDDAAFLEAMLAAVGAELCVDLDAVFLSGGSNGGMMTHYGYRALPAAWRAVMPVYGLPLVGYGGATAANNRTAILALHDRSDEVIPPDGGDGGGWLYESNDAVLGAWAAVHGCDGAPTSVRTAFDGGQKNLACVEWLGCASPGAEHRVMKCLYDGGHGSWPQQGEALAWGFFNQSRAEYS